MFYCCPIVLAMGGLIYVKSDSAFADYDRDLAAMDADHLNLRVRHVWQSDDTGQNLRI